VREWDLLTPAEPNASVYYKFRALPYAGKATAAEREAQAHSVHTTLWRTIVWLIGTPRT